MLIRAVVYKQNKESELSREAAAGAAAGDFCASCCYSCCRKPACSSPSLPTSDQMGTCLVCGWGLALHVPSDYPIACCRSKLQWKHRFYVTDPFSVFPLQRKLEALRAAVRGEEKRVSELEQQAHTTSDAADVAQVRRQLLRPVLCMPIPTSWRRRSCC